MALLHSIAAINPTQSLGQHTPLTEGSFNPRHPQGLVSSINRLLMTMRYGGGPNRVAQLLSSLG